LADQVKRLQKSVEALGKDINAVRVFIAGKHWRESTKEVARSMGYGMLFENGVDLEVVNPMTV
jgi:hypothetical protein